MNACCYKVCCCDGELDYYCFWACPTIYELVFVGLFPQLDHSAGGGGGGGGEGEGGGREEIERGV